MERTRIDARGSEGFSLIEVMVAMLVLTIGVLSLAGALALGVQRASGSSASLIAREKAREAVESVHTARDTGDLAWTRIRNVADGGVFLAGAQPLKTPGPDGLLNTADDGPELEKIRDPGPDRILGNTDDGLQPLANYTREIAITRLNRDGTTVENPNLREITVTVRYLVGGAWRTYTIRTYVSSYS